MPKSKSAEEVREEIFIEMRHIVEYWATSPGKTTEQKCEGVALSMLKMFDGITIDLPPMRIVLSPDEDDIEFHIENNEDWYEDGMVINDDCVLHEIYPRQWDNQSKRWLSLTLNDLLHWLKMHSEETQYVISDWFYSLIKNPASWLLCKLDSPLISPSQLFGPQSMCCIYCGKIHGPFSNSFPQHPTGPTSE